MRKSPDSSPKPWKGSAASEELFQALREAELLSEEMMARRALKDCFYWLTECTKTKDEQDEKDPLKPFPKREYLRVLVDVLEYEPVVFLEKSRTMMLSWMVSGWAAWKGFRHPATKVVFQSDDEDRAVHDVEYVKELWKNSLPALQRRWPHKHREIDEPYNAFYMANGSCFVGIPGNPKKVRSEHPSIYIMDEAAHIEQGEEAYNVAARTECPHLIALSSAAPGWFRDFTIGASPVDWPDYRRKRAA